MIASKELKEEISDLKKSAWKVFTMNVKGIFGNHRRLNYYKYWWYQT